MNSTGNTWVPERLSSLQFQKQSKICEVQAQETELEEGFLVAQQGLGKRDTGPRCWLLGDCKNDVC